MIEVLIAVGLIHSVTLTWLLLRVGMIYGGICLLLDRSVTSQSTEDTSGELSRGGHRPTGESWPVYTPPIKPPDAGRTVRPPVEHKVITVKFDAPVTRSAEELSQALARAMAEGEQ